jgi:hypothetical protein
MNMHYCTCSVNLSGQNFYVVQYEQRAPVSWPEVQVIMLLHGEENVTNIKPVALAEKVNPSEEKRRLQAKYGYAVVEQAFPGRVPSNMETLMPGEPENQPRVSDDGVAETMVADDDEPDEPVGRDPPTIAPVFKPGRHQRPFPAASTET